VQRAALVLAILAASVPLCAFAGELPPIVIAPFRNRCFDADDLAGRVLAQLPGAAVVVGAPPRGAHQLVRVEGDGEQVNIRLRLRNQRQQIVGTDERQLPLGEDCTAAAETAALIVVRAATPLAFRAAPRPPRPSAPVSHPSESRPSENRPSENRPSENRPSENPPSEKRIPPENPPEKPAVSENRTPPQSQPAPSGGRTAVSEVRTITPSPAPVSDNRTAEGASEKRTAENRAPRLELDVVAMWSFPLDGPPSTPAGDLTVGWRWRIGERLHLGLGARVGVSAEWSATSPSVEGPISVTARRIPVSVELRLDVAAPRKWGVIRVSAGPQAAVWLAASTGLPRPASTVIAEPGAFVRVAYRLQLGRVALQAGVDLDVAFVRDNLTVGGVGQVARTPAVLLSPFAGLGVGFL
jgi:hypothetical protein